MLWDDHQQKCIGELTFKEDVLGVRLRKDKVIVVLEKRIFVYNFSNLNLIDSIDTVSNPTGLCAVSYEDEIALIACPDKEVGRVRVNIYLKDKEEPEAPNVIEAHTSNLAALALNYQGNILATASEKGTIIRLYNPQTGDLLIELRRGKDKVELYSIAIDMKNRWVGCTSDKGTVHIFSIGKLGLSPPDDEEGQEGARNHKHPLKFMKKFAKYFDSEWSFAKFKVTDSRTICAFDKEENIIVISSDGTYYKAHLDTQNGGDCKKIQEKRILEDAT